jgi:molybdenum cofactor synthesis domain-containing protein
MKVKAGVLTLSDRASKGEYEDLSGPAIVASLDARPEFDMSWDRVEIHPDEEVTIARILRNWADEDSLDLILTTGGTGPAPRDRTPDATRTVLNQEIPGIPEAMRAAVRDRVPTAALTRGIAGIRGQTLIINLPGSPKAVRESMEVLFGFLEHLLEKIKGDPGECGGDS